MKKKPISQTALRNAVLRAVESRRIGSERLFEDPFARGLLDWRYRVFLDLILIPKIGTKLLTSREHRYPGMIGNFLCRTRYIDDLVSEALKDNLDQIMILGAGFDTRPYRLPRIDQTSVFEVDHPTTQAWKMKRVKRLFRNIPAHVTFVAVDFDMQKLDEVIKKTGFDPEAKTLIIWEGVSQYITAEAVDATFRYLLSVATPESRIIFTYINRGIIEGKVNFEGYLPLLVHHERLGEPWIFGIDPDNISSYLSERGFRLLTQAGASEYRKRYLLRLKRKMNIFSGEYTALIKISSAEM